VARSSASDRRSVRERRAVELDLRYPRRHAAGVLDPDFVGRRVVAEADLEAVPGARDARIEVQHTAADTQAQDTLDAGAVFAMCHLSV
jgi:hypothetical protein